MTSIEKFHQLDRARDMVESLNKNDDGSWTYVLIDCQNGKGRIDVYDENNNLIHSGL